jgi:flagellar biosynthesis/type III secretory pathway protein FliH
MLLRTQAYFMNRLSSLVVLFAAMWLAQPGSAQEAHLNEAGSGVILSRSAFAHGYRHGYEEGYHAGNVDINMGRQARAQKTQFHGLKLKLGYSPNFGPKHSFEEGFEAGLKAGYGDGYAGRTFRAVDSLRAAAAAMAAGVPPGDPGSADFDQGVALGYRDGFQQGESATPAAASMDLHRQAACTQSHADVENDAFAQGSYCEGYRRGFALGRADGLISRIQFDFLEASK